MRQVIKHPECLATMLGGHSASSRPIAKAPVAVRARYLGSQVAVVYGILRRVLDIVNLRLGLRGHPAPVSQTLWCEKSPGVAASVDR